MPVFLSSVTCELGRTNCYRINLTFAEKISLMIMKAKLGYVNELSYENKSFKQIMKFKGFLN